MKLALLALAIAALPGSVLACTNAVTTINPQIGSTVHVTIVDQNCNGVPPSGLTVQGSPNPSGYLQITDDTTGINFKGLAGGQFTFTITDPVGATPFPSMTLTVTVGPIPTAISATSP